MPNSKPTVFGKSMGTFSVVDDHPAIHVVKTDFDVQIRCLFHEATHFNQYLENRLIETPTYRTYNEYFNSDIEVEARDQEEKMAVSYEKFMIKNYDRHYGL